MIRQRIISGLILVIAVVLAVLTLPPFWSTTAISVLLLFCAWEWSGFLATRRVESRLLFIVLAALCCAGLWRVTGTPLAMNRVLWVALGFWTLAGLWIAVLPVPVNRALAWITGLAVLSLAWIALSRMRMNWELGSWWVLYALAIVWVADSGAYFAGMRWGRRKLAPRVSPGKTWVGLFGGIAAVALLAVVATHWLLRPMPQLVLISMVVALYSVVGDLTESLFKRYAGLKDSGALIPGHGGVLDRFDSLLAAAPVLMLGASLLEGLPS